MVELPVFVARDASKEILGLLSLLHHNEATSEVYIIGVRKEFHRLGIGRALVARALLRLTREALSFF